MCWDTRFPSSWASCASSSAVPGRCSGVLRVRPVLTCKTLHPSCTAGRASEPGASDANSEPEGLQWQDDHLAPCSPELSSRLPHPTHRPEHLVDVGAEELARGVGQG